MWYVIQVRTGTEESICLQCTHSIPPAVLERSFIPRYQEKKRYQGQWHTQEKILFPGYVFLVSSDLEQLFEALRKVVGLTRLLGTGKEIVPLSEPEIQLLLKLGNEDQLVQMSEGIIENDKVKIIKGPLVGMEGYIKKIDRHKRKAWIEVEMFGRVVDVEVGVEIIYKE